ncbi:uncharacterized protein LOC114458826 [Gouania willdenowi]|uniref:uncharacterized protein LOC114458826 n=1 Tax=Gouania willdenowi TaxID=441366 RepID=UPI00105500F8|nr:uncharacterized protein LOC114458826 [Gouania willdenowi]
MAHPKLRVIVEDNDYRRLDLPSGMPETLTELHNTIREAFGVEHDFNIQFMDPDFNNDFMNLTTVQDLQDRGTIKLVYMQNVVGVSPVSSLRSTPSTSLSSETLVSSQSSPCASSIHASSTDSDSTIILKHSDSELRERAWPRNFPIPRFSYNVEMQLQQGNESFRDTGNQLKIAPGLKSEILEKLAEEIFLYTAYPQNYQIDDVAGALIKKFPCLKEQSATGYYSWMISLKYKMANYRTKMRIIGCPEVTVNALKNKSSDECLPAKNVKKPKKAEVNFFPSHPAGETDESLEKVRLELLVDIRQRNTASRVREKMSKTFSYRRKEVVQEKPTAGEVKTRWPALFHISEKKGAQVGQKLAQHLEVLQEETSDINLRREAVLKGLCIYLGEDDAHLIKEYMDIEGDDILKDIKKSPMGIYVINKEGGRPRHFDDIGIHVEGEILLDNIGSEAQACAMMLGVIYALNMTYPKELRYYYEFIQKVLMQMERGKLSPRVLGLRNKMIAGGL